MNNIYDHENEVKTKMEPRTDVPRGFKGYKDPWVEKYGKAVLDNSLQDRIENRKIKALHGTPTQQFIVDQENNPLKSENQMAFCEYSVIRDIVLKVLKAQGIPNPSDEVIDNAIKEHLEKGYQKVKFIKKKCNNHL